MLSRGEASRAEQTMIGKVYGVLAAAVMMPSGMRACTIHSGLQAATYSA